MLSYEKALMIYGEDNLVKIVNSKQVLTYLKHGVQPIGWIEGYADKTVFVFVKEDTRELYEKWLNHELK